MVALITPFQDGDIDFRTLDELIEFQLENGIDAIVPVGTTGESPTLDNAEHKKVIERVVKTVAGQVPVIAGAGSNSTAEAIDYTAFAKKVGADASLQVCPYYNKPTQQGFYEHFKAIAEEVDLPIVLYNIPGRCGGTGLSPDTIANLAEIENIVAIKEATGSLDLASEIATRCDITLVSGDDSLTLPIASVGGKGVISGLIGFHLSNDVHILAGEWVTLNIEFNGEHLSQFINIRISNVSLVWTGVDRDTMTASLDSDLCRFHNRWYADIAGISQQGYLVYIDA